MAELSGDLFTEEDCPLASPFDPALTEAEVASLLPSYTNLQALDPTGQGCVFRGQSSAGSLVAIKVYSPDQLLVRAEMEIQKLQALNSPFVVKLVDHGEIEIRGRQSVYSVTRFEEGEDLKKRLAREGRLPEEEVRHLLTHMSHGIDALWGARVVHCDIKPANILLGADGCYRLVDLGIAKHLDNQTVTQAGVVLGTPGYMAPEQLRGRKNFTLRVDLFALGIVAYQALTGCHPFQGNQLAIATGRVQPERPSTMVKVTPNVERTIMKLLQLDPLHRPMSGSEVISMLEAKA